MKTFFNIRLILPILALAGLVSCVGEPDRPAAPQTDLHANITIADLVSRFGKISYTDLDSAWYIEGVVVGNDIAGNIYKKIYLQDETGGIDIEIEMTNNHHKYPIGQRLVVSLKGLAMGLYGGQPQIAGQGNYVVHRLYEPECDEHFFRKGYASAANMPEPILLTLNEIKFRPNLYVGRLIRINSVHFEDEDVTFATAGDDGNGSNRNIVDKNNNVLICRNSTYALFANDTLPIGIGDMVGILGIYNGDPQFYFRDKDDIINFAIPSPANLQTILDSIELKATLKWERGYAYTDSIRVYFKEITDSDYTVSTITEDVFEIIDIKPNTTYQWKVQALYKERYSSEISEEQIFTTTDITSAE